MSKKTGEWGDTYEERSQTLYPYKRFQSGLTVSAIYPPINGRCSCCKNELPKRKRRWCSQECVDRALNEFHIIKGDAGVIRAELYKLDQGACRICGEITENWHADHIIPVHKGGGGRGIDNFQTLCKPCHKEKTFTDKQ